MGQEGGMNCLVFCLFLVEWGQVYFGCCVVIKMGVFICYIVRLDLINVVVQVYIYFVFFVVCCQVLWVQRILSYYCIYRDFEKRFCWLMGDVVFLVFLLVNFIC